MILALMMTYQCNFHCRHCMVDSSHEYSCVSDKVIERFFKTLDIIKPDWVYLIGGEVLLHIELLEKIIPEIKKKCTNIMVFSNGTFLLNDALTNRVNALNITIRISDDRFHREQWNDTLRERILSSPYIIVRPPDESEDESGGFMIPVGRAYEEFKHLKRNLGCSLLTGNYDEEYKNHHRIMIMMNGDVNLYCATIEGALANVFEDDVTYELLVRRERILHNYLYREVIHSEEDKYMATLCNMCQKYKVNANNIIYDGKVVASVSDYSE